MGIIGKHPFDQSSCAVAIGNFIGGNDHTGIGDLGWLLLGFKTGIGSLALGEGIPNPLGNAIGVEVLA